MSTQDLGSFNKIELPKYTQIGSYSHKHILGGQTCEQERLVAPVTVNDPVSRAGFSFLAFDNEGEYLASVAEGGCVTVVKFEEIQPAGIFEEPSPFKIKHIFHKPTYRGFDVVKWNPHKREQVACISIVRDVLSLYNVQSTHLLVHDKVPLDNKGLSDIIFTPDGSTIFGSGDRSNLVHMWDLREGTTYHTYTTNSNSIGGHLKSIDMSYDSQVIFGADHDGFIHLWDVRMGQSNRGFHIPFHSYILASGIEEAVRERTGDETLFIPSVAIRSIDFDPSSHYQLGFHLVNGWSGVLNTNYKDAGNMKVTHLHTHNSPLMAHDQKGILRPAYKSQAAWLPHSIYAVGSLDSEGVHLLDFYPRLSIMEAQTFVPVTGTVTACAAHKLSGNLVVGTQERKMVVISKG